MSINSSTNRMRFLVDFSDTMYVNPCAKRTHLDVTTFCREPGFDAETFHAIAKISHISYDIVELTKELETEFGSKHRAIFSLINAGVINTTFYDSFPMNDVMISNYSFTPQPYSGDTTFSAVFSK